MFLLSKDIFVVFIITNQSFPIFLFQVIDTYNMVLAKELSTDKRKIFDHSFIHHGPDNGQALPAKASTKGMYERHNNFNDFS